MSEICLILAVRPADRKVRNGRRLGTLRCQSLAQVYNYRDKMGKFGTTRHVGALGVALMTSREDLFL
jgi:hypothetical protein